MVETEDVFNLIPKFFNINFLFEGSLALNILILSFVLAIISLFIWEFYKSTSKRNLIELDLGKYNTSEHPLNNKLFAILLYFIEYLLIMPLLIILWFTGLSFVLILIANERAINEVLFLSAALIGAIRILAYYNREISKDLAKLFPFITLSVFLLTPGAFDFNAILSQIQVMPNYIGNLFSYILIVLAIEIVLRLLYTTYAFLRSDEDEMLGKGGNKEKLE